MENFISYLNIFLTTALVGNVVLTQFLGICPFVGMSKKRQSALGMGLAVIFVIVFSSLITYGIQYLILKPFNVQYLQTMVFILTIASLVQFLEFFLRKMLPTVYRMLGSYLPLITTNCAVLGVAKIVADTSTPDVQKSFLEAFVYAFGTATGFAFVLFLFATIRERLESSNVPRPLKGAPIAFIMIALLAMAFVGFEGLL